MVKVGALVLELVEETRAGWSWMLPLAEEEAPAWLAFQGPRGMRGDPPVVAAGPPRLELWPRGGGPRPLVEVPVAANRNPRQDFARLSQQRLDPTAGWLLLLALLVALDEAPRARPRVPTVGDRLTSTGAPTLSAWASALTLADLQTALLRSQH